MLASGASRHLHSFPTRRSSDLFSYWVAGPVTAAVAATGLLLMHQAAPGFVWAWGNLLVAIALARAAPPGRLDRKSTRLNSSHTVISYAVFCLKKKIQIPLT